MAEDAPDAKVPKTPKRVRFPADGLRRVDSQNSNHGGSAAPSPSAAADKINNFHRSSNGNSNFNTNTNNTTTTSNHDARDNQPESFPQLGAFPSSNVGPGQWHTSADPTQSFRPAAQQLHAPSLPAGFTQLPQGPHFLPAHDHNNNFVGYMVVNSHPSPPPQPLPASTTYIGIPQPQPQPQLYPHPHLHLHPHATMADYQNAAPMPNGVHFQPPVPDSTFGPMMHTFYPRFDAGFVPAGVQQPTLGVPFAQPGCVVAPPQPTYIQQPMGVPQPVMMGAQPIPQPAPGFGGVPAVGMGGTVPMVAAGNSGQPPDVSGLGRTPMEETLRQISFAHSNKLFEPQDMKPGDDDPSRFYYVREVDGNWTQRNRFTIDALGDCRWYVTDEGWFYAVRMPN